MVFARLDVVNVQKRLSTAQRELSPTGRTLIAGRCLDLRVDVLAYAQEFKFTTKVLVENDVRVKVMPVSQIRLALLDLPRLAIMSLFPREHVVFACA